MRLRGLGHIPRVRGREDAYPPSEAAVRVGEANTQPSSRVWADLSARYTNPKSFLVVGSGGPVALAGAKGPGFFCVNPRGKSLRNSNRFPARSCIERRHTDGGSRRGLPLRIGGP